VAVKKVFIAGHKGMVGAALLRQLRTQPDVQIIVTERQQLDLTEQAAVQSFMAEHQPDEVYLAAAKVGGIWFNNNIGTGQDISIA